MLVWGNWERSNVTLIIFKNLAALTIVNYFVSLDIIEKPKFTYVEKKVVKITYEKGVNRTLFICCTAPKLDSFFKAVVCKLSHMSPCPGFKQLLSCNAKGQQVCCQLDRVLEHLTIKGYVAKIDGNRTVSSSDVATYVTNAKGKL